MYTRAYKDCVFNDNPLIDWCDSIEYTNMKILARWKRSPAKRNIFIIYLFKFGKQKKIHSINTLFDVLYFRKSAEWLYTGKIATSQSYIMY